jgi:hypothetical protein
MKKWRSLEEARDRPVPISSYGEIYKTKWTRRIRSSLLNVKRIIYIPFPPIEIQRVIVQQMLERVAEITKERERADRLGVVTKQEVEEMILGTRPVP